jgi:HK97 gp10 family phage protein
VTLPPTVDVALNQGAESIAEEAQNRVPIASGKLRDAIHVDRKDTGEVFVVAGDDEVFYGHLVEYGTTNTGAQPFLIPALEDKRATVLADVTVALRSL